MADLAEDTAVAADDLAADDNARANALTGEQVDEHVVPADVGAAAPFAERTGVCIVLDKDGCSNAAPSCLQMSIFSQPANSVMTAMRPSRRR